MMFEPSDPVSGTVGWASGAGWVSWLRPLLLSRLLSPTRLRGRPRIGLRLLLAHLSWRGASPDNGRARSSPMPGSAGDVLSHDGPTSTTEACDGRGLTREGTVSGSFMPYTAACRLRTF